MLLLLLACDDHVFGASSAVPISGDGYTDVNAIFEGSCLGCHSAAAKLGGLDLETDACGALVDVPAAGYDGTLVVPGDASTSVLWNKVANTGVYGGQMPQGAALDTTSVNTIGAWIDAGASCSDTGTTDTTPTTTTTDTTPTEGYTFQMVQETVFDASCTYCHFEGNEVGTGGGLDLTSPASYDHLVDQPSGLYPPIRLVTPGDPARSLLMLKVLDAQSLDGTDRGSAMPLGGSLDTDQVTLLLGWIREGASR